MRRLYGFCRTLFFTNKSYLVLITTVWSLLYLNHLSIFEEVKAMPPGCKKDDVTGLEDSFGEIFFVIGVKGDIHFPFPDDEGLLGVLDLPGAEIVDMFLNDIASLVREKPELLGECPGSEEFYFFRGVIYQKD